MYRLQSGNVLLVEAKPAENRDLAGMLCSMPSDCFGSLSQDFGSNIAFNMALHG